MTGCGSLGRYQVPVRFSRWCPPPPVLHRAQNVPFDQLIWLPSGLSVPVTNCHPGATMPFWPWYCPVEVSPFSLVKVRNTPLSLMEACLVGSPWAHQPPVKAADRGLGGDWAKACFTLNVRLTAKTAAQNVMTAARYFDDCGMCHGFSPVTNQSSGPQKGT